MSITWGPNAVRSVRALLSAVEAEIEALHRRRTALLAVLEIDAPQAAAVPQVQRRRRPAPDPMHVLTNRALESLGQGTTRDISAWIARNDPYLGRSAKATFPGVSTAISGYAHRFGWVTDTPREWTGLRTWRIATQAELDAAEAAGAEARRAGAEEQSCPYRSPDARECRWAQGWFSVPAASAPDAQVAPEVGESAGNGEVVHADQQVLTTVGQPDEAATTLPASTPGAAS